MRKLVVSLAVLIALLIALDFGARVWAGSWVGERIEQSLHLSEKPSVSFGGFPFLVEVGRGDVPSATVTARTLSIHGVPLESVVLHLRYVTFSPSQLLLRRAGTIRASSGTGTATLTGEGLSRALAKRGAQVRVRIAGGLVHLSSPRIPGEVTARLSIEGRRLVLRASSAVPVDFHLELPAIVPGIRFGRVEAIDDTLSVEVGFDEVSFDVGRR